MSQPVLMGLTHIERTIEIIREFEPPDEGYYLAFSGGKDSQVLYELTKWSGVRFDAHYNVTGIDPPELVHHIRRHYPEVAFDHPPRENWWTGIPVHGLPGKRTRWCCEVLKEHGGAYRVILTGIRAEESYARRGRGMVHACQRQGKHMVNPIFFWTETQVWEFIRGEGLPYCELYDQGYRRLGCVVCPFWSPENTQRNLVRWPRIFAATKKQARKHWERGNPKGPQTRFATFDDWWQWWLARRLPWPGRLDEEPDQLNLFCPDEEAP